MKRAGIITAVVVSALLAPAALGASVDGVYKGGTSQGFHFRLKAGKEMINGKRYLTITVDTKLHYKCASGPLTQPYQFGVPTMIHRNGTFTLVVGGGPNGFESHIKGAIKDNRVSGAIRAEIVTPRCTSGAVTFTAKR